MNGPWTKDAALTVNGPNALTDWLANPWLFKALDGDGNFLEWRLYAVQGLYDGDGNPEQTRTVDGITYSSGIVLYRSTTENLSAADWQYVGLADVEQALSEQPCVVQDEDGRIWMLGDAGPEGVRVLLSADGGITFRPTGQMLLKSDGISGFLAQAECNSVSVFLAPVPLDQQGGNRWVAVYQGSGANSWMIGVAGPEPLGGSRCDVSQLAGPLTAAGTVLAVLDGSQALATSVTGTPLPFCEFGTPVNVSITATMVVTVTGASGQVAINVDDGTSHNKSAVTVAAGTAAITLVAARFVAGGHAIISIAASALAGSTLSVSNITWTVNAIATL